MSKILTTMRGLRLTGHGGLDMLELADDLPLPCPGSRNVLNWMVTVGVNHTDINTRTAWCSRQAGASKDDSWSGTLLLPPRIQGANVCGETVATGRVIETGRTGEWVLVELCLREVDRMTPDQAWYLGLECDGGFVEYMVAATRRAWRIDSPFSAIKLASFPCSYSTA